MSNYLSNIPTEIIQVGKEYHIIYSIQEDTMTIVGGCNYKEWEQRSKYQTEPVYLLTQVYMLPVKKKKKKERKTEISMKNKQQSR